MPKVSVVIPIYNVEDYLDQALESVKRQTLQDIEIICVNDGSTDNSLGIIKKWAEGDDRFVIIDKENEGYGVGMNIGISRATGEYIAILEPDDFVMLTMYEDLYKVAKENELDIVKSDYYKFTTNPRGNIVLRYVPVTRTEEYYNKVFDPSHMPELTGTVQRTWIGLYRRAFLEDNGIRHNTTPGASYQDNGFFWKTTVNAKRVMYIARPYYMYRTDNPNQSVKKRDKVYARDQEYDNVKEYLMDKGPETWDLFKHHYNLSRFKKSLVNLKRIDDIYVDEYIAYARKYFEEAESLGEFDPEMLSVEDRAAYDSLMNSPETFYKKHISRRARIEKERNTDIFTVLREKKELNKTLKKRTKALKKENKKLKSDNKELKKSLNKIENSRSFKLAIYARKAAHYIMPVKRKK